MIKGNGFLADCEAVGPLINTSWAVKRKKKNHSVSVRAVGI